MSIFSWAENAFKKFSVWDIAVFKLYLFTVGMIVGAYLAVFVKQYVWYFVVVAVIALSYLLNRMFK